MDFYALLQAIKCCLADKIPAKRTAIAFGIPRSSLQRYIKKVTGQFNEISSVEDGVLLEFVRDCSQRTPSNMVFSLAREKDLVQYILKCLNHYYDLSISELRELAYQFAKKLAVDYPENWDKDQMAGRHWYTKFMRRHSELEFITPHSSTSRVSSGPLTSRAFSTICQSLLEDIVVEDKKPTKRSRKPMQSSAPTSAERIELPDMKASVSPQKKRARKAPQVKPSTKRTKETPSKPSAKRTKVQEALPSDGDLNFCLICLNLLPSKLTAANSIKCNECSRPVHFKCSYFTCKDCASNCDE